MKISVVLAVFNEENYLDDCLASIIGWCDEIVIVDGNSTDKTRDIAQKYGAKIIVIQNQANFHHNKQRAISEASGEWILQLDADERLTDELKKEITEKICNEEVVGYWIPRKNYFLGRFLMKGGVYPDYTLRLYRNGKGRLPAIDVHEQAVVSGKTAYLKNPLIHMADKDLHRYFLRFNRYTDLLSQEISGSKQLFIIKCINFCFLKPIHWFLLTFIRHKGFLDLWQGFLFSFFSSLRFPVSFIKSLKKV